MITLRFWGTRGSVPTPGPATVRYGGNTACVEVRGPDGELVVFDAGTGLRELGIHLQRQRHAALEIHLFLSHLHWDHIQGLPFFRPAYDPSTSLRIYGPPQKSSLREMLGIGMDDPFFPVDLDALPAKLVVTELDGPLSIGPFHFRMTSALHPAPCLSYRADVAGRSVVYATDTEDAFSTGPNPIVPLAAGADLLIHDAQYVAEDVKPGWGHSTVEKAVDVAVRAKVRHLVLYHHDPDRSDDALDRIGERAVALARERDARLVVTVAREGLELTL